MVKKRTIALVAGVATLGVAAYFGYRHFEADEVRRRDQQLLWQACTHVQVSLRIDARTIRKRSESDMNNRLANDLIRRVYSDPDSAGEGPTMLNICAPGFPVDEWTVCRDKADDACMIRILEATAATIIQRFGKGPNEQ